MPKRKPIDHYAVLSDYESGMGLCRLSKKYGVDKTTVRKWLRELGVDTSVRTNTKADDSQIIDAVATLYEKYCSAEKVAAEIGGVSAQTVRNMLARNGISLKKRVAVKHEKTVRISNCGTKNCPVLAKLYRVVCGYTNKQIADAMSITTNDVCGIFRRKYPELHETYKRGLSDEEIEAIERDYVNGASCYELGEKYGIYPSSISKMMIRLGHCRGRGHGPAHERHLASLRTEADKQWLEEFGEDYGSLTGGKGQKIRRYVRIASRCHDAGITWRAVAKRNGSMHCEICGVECSTDDRRWGTSGPTYPNVDHIIRICDGGTDTWDNVRLACCKCNLAMNASASRGRCNHAEKQGATDQRTSVY